MPLPMIQSGMSSFSVILPLTAALALSFLGCSTSGSPSSSTSTLERRFQKADANSDGKLTRTEYSNAMIEQIFEIYDSNSNGKITLEEFVAGGGTEKSFRDIDRDNSGVLTLEEAKNARIVIDAMTANFYAIDLDRDGTISLAEAIAYREKARPYFR